MNFGCSNIFTCPPIPLQAKSIVKKLTPHQYIQSITFVFWYTRWCFTVHYQFWWSKYFNKVFIVHLFLIVGEMGFFFTLVVRSYYWTNYNSFLRCESLRNSWKEKGIFVLSSSLLSEDKLGEKPESVSSRVLCDCCLDAELSSTW